MATNYPKPIFKSKVEQPKPSTNENEIPENEVVETQKQEPTITVPLAKITQTENLTNIQKLVKIIDKENYNYAKILIEVIEKYIVKMNPILPQTDDSGSKAQHSFYKSILNSLNAEDKEFKIVMNVIIDYFKVHGQTQKHIFSEYNLFRFNKEMPFNTNASKEDVKDMERLFTLFKTLSGLNDIYSITKHIDLQRIVPDSLGDNKDKIIGFLNKSF